MIDWRDEWARNPRLRWAALAVAALLALWLWLAGSDAVQARRADNDRLELDRDRLQRLQQEGFWTEHRKVMRVLDDAWQARLWKAPSDGRMQAQLQDWLQGELAAAGFRARELEVQVLPHQGALRLVRARLFVDIDPARAHELLLRLGEAPGLIRVTRLQLRATVLPSQVQVAAGTALGHAELELEAAYQIQGSGAASGAPA